MMRTTRKVLSCIPSALLSAVVTGCPAAVVESALTSLRDGTAGVATSAIGVLFENQFGLPAEGDSEDEEESGNDLFVHP